MDRLQKKGFVFSISLHGVLFAFLVLGAGLLASKQKNQTVRVLDFIPAKVVEGLLAGGGNPEARPPPPAPPPPQPQAQTQPQTPPKKPEVPKPERRIEPPPPKTATPDPMKAAPKVPPKRWEAKPDKPEIQPNLTPTVRSPKTAAANKAQAEIEDRRRAEAARQASVSSALENLRSSFSSSTKVDIPGPGGEAYAGYSLVIQSIYQKYWIKPSESSDATSIVKVTVTIDKNGNVISAQITKGSGNPAVDSSVRRTLDRVRKVPAFPEGSKDEQRIFDIDFNLTAKQSFG